MKESLLCAINAIESAPEDADCGGIVDYCTEHGLPEDVVLTLVNIPGKTDAGRLAQALAAVERDEAAESEEDAVNVDAFIAANAPAEDEEPEEDDGSDAAEDTTDSTENADGNDDGGNASADGNSADEGNTGSDDVS